MGSRKDVDQKEHINLETVKENGQAFIMAANMQGVGTFGNGGRTY